MNKILSILFPFQNPRPLIKWEFSRRPSMSWGEMFRAFK